MISVKNMDHFTFVVKNRGMGLLSCLFIKKKSFEHESPFLRSNGVTNRKRNNFTGKTEMLLIKKN